MRPGLLLCAASALVAPAVQAQERPVGEAVALVQAFVDEHLARIDAGQQPLLNDASAARPYLEDGLAQDGLQGRLQFDPVFDAQDFDITELYIAADARTPILQGAAQVVASFRNFGAPQEMLYTLVPVPPTGDWQISDIYSPANGWSLSDLVGTRAASSGPEVLFAQASADEPEIGMEQGDLPGFAPDASRPDLLFILDGSGSMWGQIDGVAKITTAKEALSALANDLAGTTNLGLMAYGHRREGDCGDTEVLLSTGQHEPRVIADMVEGVSPRGKTPIAASLRAAPQAFSAGDRQSEVLLISDGLETCGGDPCAAAAALRAQGVQTRVHVVGFDLTTEEQAALACIAEEGGGLYLTADTAEELGDALTQVAQATQAEPAPPAPEPEPEPEPEPQPTGPNVVFEETFDGPAIDEAWTVENPTPELAALDGEGALFVAALGETTYRQPEARNRYVLDRALPDGDFDLVAQVRTRVQTGREGVFVSLYDGADSQVVAVLYATWQGCGRALNLALVRLGADETVFDQNLFDGPLVRNICTDGRAYGDAVLDTLAEEGAELRLVRRGREVTARLDLVLPAAEGQEGGPVTIETEPVTVLRASGRPSVLLGQYANARDGESLYELDRFAIETP